MDKYRITFDAVVESMFNWKIIYVDYINDIKNKLELMVYYQKYFDITMSIILSD